MSTRTAMPAHIKAHLEATGVLARDGISRRAKTTFCADCHQVVIRGLDADVAALVAVVDPAPLTALGEVLALAGGRTTYELTWRGARYELDPRNPGHIARRPAGEFHIAPEHKCGDPLPTKAPIMNRAPGRTDSDECPF